MARATISSAANLGSGDSGVRIGFGRPNARGSSGGVQDVERGAGQVAAAQGVAERAEVDQAAPPQLTR